MIRRCSDCGEIYEWVGKSKQWYCRTCRNKRKREYNNKHPEKAKEYGKKRKETIRAYLQRLKEEPCVDCGRCYPYYVMDFDHVRGEKSFGIATVGGMSRSLKIIKEELEKCDLVCANCHRIGTHKWREGRHV